MFCPGVKCPHYNEATRYPRKCYYEPQCLRGYLDVIVAALRLAVVYRLGFRRYENNKQIETARRD